MGRSAVRGRWVQGCRGELGGVAGVHVLMELQRCAQASGKKRTKKEQEEEEGESKEEEAEEAEEEQPKKKAKTASAKKGSAKKVRAAGSSSASFPAVGCHCLENAISTCLTAWKTSRGSVVLAFACG